MSTLQINIRETCLKVAHHLSDLETLQQVALQPKNFHLYNHAFPWEGTSLSYGYPSLICLFSELEQVLEDESWAELTHRCIQKLTEEIQEKGVPNLTLFSGLTGICAAVHLASCGGQRYQGLLAKLHANLFHHLPLVYQRQQDQPHLYRECDVISGVSGVVSHLLNFTHIPEAEHLTRHFLNLICAAVKPRKIGNLEVPGWYIPINQFIRQEDCNNFPNGCFDLGMAHGITGCLAALSKAHMQGIWVEGQKEAIRGIAAWLKGQFWESDETVGAWPSCSPFYPKGAETNISLRFVDGWCYGSPGVANALFLAAIALRDDELSDFAIQSMLGVCRRVLTTDHTRCLSLCHGLGGLLTMIHHFYLRSHHPLFQKTTENIAKRIIASYHPTNPFGFKALVETTDGSHIAIDNPGLLDGAVGTVLSLLSYCSNTPRSWTQIFLIA